MKRFAATLLFFVLLSVNVPSQVKQIAAPVEPPADFKGDGCTGFPDGDYADCCFAHDKDYFRGGTKEERLASDNRLFKCVNAKSGFQHKLIAPIMWLGVRIGGPEFVQAPFSWGFGQQKAKK
jgi:hypothetical protein